jgi:membrane-bound serine protease (ClpP class)
LLAVAALASTLAQTEAPRVRVLRVRGMIHAVTAAIIDSALETASREGDSLVILELDTPGGLVDATEQIVQSMLNSSVPVCVYVSPRGAHAASAGFFLLIAADVAAMAPLTRTGASHPITAGGPNREDDVALKKVAEDLSALLRTTASRRGRSPEIAEQAVREAKSWTAEEALASGLIELIANDGTDLLRQLDGREVVRPDGTTTRLATSEFQLVHHRIEWRKRLASVILHPVMLGLMLALASLGIYIELTHPGLILPGLVGAACLLVFLYGSSVLPVNYLAAALIALGLVMFLLEIKVSSYGLLGIGGAIAVLVGLYLLLPRDIPGLAIPLRVLIPLGLSLVLLLGFVTFLVARSQRAPIATGREAAIGAIGRVEVAIDPLGKVFVHGELWSANADRRLEVGRTVRVVSHDGLQLKVEAVDETRSD